MKFTKAKVRGWMNKLETIVDQMAEALDDDEIPESMRECEGVEFVGATQGEIESLVDNLRSLVDNWADMVPKMIKCCMCESEVPEDDSLVDADGDKFCSQDCLDDAWEEEEEDA